MLFGPFSIDPRTWTLARDGKPLELSPRLVQLLAHLVEQDGRIVTRDELLDRFWPDVHVTENNLTRALADVRKALGDDPHQPRVIQTLARRGYRFVGQRHDEAEREDPFQTWIAGRLALETLDPARLAEAHAAMTRAASAMPDYAPAHAGLANASLVAFEATRTRNVPDFAALDAAVATARSATALDPRLGEGWAVLGHALALSGRSEDAQAALRRAVTLEPDSWRHHFRLALVSWGEDRLRESNRTLALLPSCAAAHLLAATVFVARGAWERAHEAASEGARLQQAQADGAALPAAGLHWMRGLVAMARRDDAAAAAAFAEEAAGGSVGVYGREFSWLAHTCLGFVHAHAGQGDAAAAAFESAEATNPGAARNVLGRVLLTRAAERDLERALAELGAGHKQAEAALVRAAVAAWSGESASAVGALTHLVAAAPPGMLGWSVAADPMLAPLLDTPERPALLALIASRAA